MRIIGWLLAGCIALAVFRAALMVAIVIYLALLLASLIVHPRETLGIMLFWALCTMPTKALLTVGIGAVIFIAAKRLMNMPVSTTSALPAD